MGQTAQAQVVEGIAGEHAAYHPHRGEAVKAGELDALTFQELKGFFFRDAAVCDVLLKPRPERLP